MDALLVLFILSVSILLFASNRIRVDLVSLMILLALGITGLVTPAEAFSGFSNPAVITVAAMFILSSGLTHTGALQPLTSRLLEISRQSEQRMVITIMLTSALFSAFINNIAATALLMPLTIEMGKKGNVNPSKLLIPLAFGSLLGGVCTLIGTPPNLLANALLMQHAGTSFSMFDFTPLGIVLLIAGVLYMSTFGRRFLPERKTGTLTSAYQVKAYIAEVEVLPGAAIANKTIAASRLEENHALKVRAILRGRQKFPFPHRNRKILAGDILFVEGNPKTILQLHRAEGLQVVPEKEYPKDPHREREDVLVIEASLTPTSEMVGKTLREVKFAETYGLTVLAIWRSGAPVVRKVDHVILRFGDVLLLQGTHDHVVHLSKNHGFLLLGDIETSPYRPHRGPASIAILAGAILLATGGIMPIMLSATLGALLMVLSRCLSIKDAYESIDWSIILLIAGTLPLGIAMESSGLAAKIAGFLIQFSGTLGPWPVLSILIFLTILLTAIMSNAATVVLLAPIAYSTAISLNVDPKPFFMGIALAASICFISPIGHQSNALVMGPGGYRFSDYTRSGMGLNLICWALASLLIPVLFPF
ncbi:MAG: SLC13 family permease [Geopsychrobacter sp.]|nr:SLC13 family permease [Geopsychrobacter sp.]